MAKNDSPEVTMDRRANDRRGSGDRRTKQVATETERRTGERRKVQRRRQIDPTTCERDYANDEIEFMHALDEYKRKNGRMFPTCSEILEVLKDLGYRRLDVENAVQEEVVALSADVDDEQHEDDELMEFDEE